MISTDDLFELKLRALDGDIGSVSDLVFSDSDWTIHALTAETGGWLLGKRVSIDPDVLREPDVAARVLPVEMTKDEVKDAPPADAALSEASPVSAEVLEWNQSNALSGMPETLLLAGAPVPARPLVSETRPAHRRGVQGVLGYVVTAREEPAGILRGFLVDVIAWDLPLALIELEAGGPSVLLPTRLIAEVSPMERTLRTYLDPEVLQNAPSYDPRVLDERIYLPAVTDYYSTRVETRGL